MNNQIQSPVLLIGFNRPDTMQKVFDAVRKAHPLKLYYAVDCARKGKDGEAEKVNQVKDIIKQVDWSCEVFTLFQKTNRGCGYGPSGAISWAFENEDRLIVLEDDCVPSQSFFRFCDEMLDRYEKDTRVNIISGRSHHSGTKFFEDKDYIFTHYAHTWGWATWKRAWSSFDILMRDFPSFVRAGGSANVFFDDMEVAFWDKKFESAYLQIEKEVTHSWDMQWVYARLKEGGLGIVPSQNLISNIGAGNGTHTSSQFVDMPSRDMPETIRHPKFVIVNREYEEFHFKRHICYADNLFKRVLNRIKQ